MIDHQGNPITINMPCVADVEKATGTLLHQNKQTLAIAESCTGGLISHRMTNIAGSSAYLLGGVVAYAYAIKTQLLKVKQNTLDQFGAVSAQTALEMAHGVREIMQADIGIATTGIAGPDGGTAEKPVGTVWIALATASGAWAFGFCWDGDRTANKQYSADAALNLLHLYLTGSLQQQAKPV